MFGVANNDVYLCKGFKYLKLIQMIRIERFYTDTSNFDEETKFPYAKAFAKSLEWLYDGAFFQEEDESSYYWNSRYNMSGIVPLVDLISIEACVISKAWGEFGISNVNSLIAKLEKERAPLGLDEDDLYLKREEKHLIIGKMKDNISEVILWVAYVYSRFRGEMEENNEKAKCGAQLLYRLFVQKSGYKENTVKQHFLMRHLDYTMKTFAQNINAKSVSTENRKICKAKDNRTEALEARIKELEAENAELKDTQKELYEDISLHDKVRLDLLLRLLERDGANIEIFGNKAKAAHVMQAITGLPATTCKNYCTNRDLSLTHHEEEILKMNAILQALGMGIRL